jgi:hypothetical protein
VIQEERRGRYQDLMNVDAGFIESKTNSEWIRDWGERSGISPAFALQEGSGLIIGASYDKTDFGFRRVPYETRYALTGMVSPTTGRLGAEFVWDRHPENSRFGFGLTARGSQLEANRFFGWGNESPFDDDLDATLVRRDQVTVQPALRYAISQQSFFSVGPIARWTSPHIDEGSAADSLLSHDSESSYGARAEFVFNNTVGAMPRSGFAVRSEMLAFDDHATATGTAATFFSFGRPTLALRVGGSKVFGDEFPLQDAAFIGGSSSLRGYRWNRFAGDAALFGGAELRFPVTRAVLFTRGDLGILALADAGRVWFDGESEGGWHTGVGGGLYFHTLGQTISVQYAQGEDEGRFYVKFGAAF